VIGTGMLIEDAPTGGVYSLASARETPVEDLPTLNTANLVAAIKAAVAELEEPTQTTQPARSPHLHQSAIVEYLLSALLRERHPATLFRAMLDEPFLIATPYTLDPFVGSGSLSATALRGIKNVHALITIDETAPDSEDVAAEAPPAFHAFKDLGRWLDADDGEVARMVGFGRTTPYSWKRSGTEPRVGTVRRLYEYHAALDSLYRHLGDDDLRRWLHLGAPATRRETLLGGALEELERDVHEALFRRSPETRLGLAAGPEDAGAVGARGGQAPRASRRRPRRLKA
jgi:hypothetical protein